MWPYSTGLVQHQQKVLHAFVGSRAPIPCSLSFHVLDFPVDLKGAISSLIFASRRCAAEIPELICVRKHFTAKYGKEFVSADVELLPDCGVYILWYVYIKWDPDSYGGENESKSLEALLIHQSTEGMNSYGNAAVIFDDPGSVQMTITVNLMWRRTTRDKNLV
ncbi:unnamed protein product [Prunus armeniaca]